jgi:hypothetical protein
VHRRTGSALLDQEDGLSRQVSTSQLGHSEPSIEPGSPDEPRINVDSRWPPARRGLTRADAGEFISRPGVGH